MRSLSLKGGSVNPSHVFFGNIFIYSFIPYSFQSLHPFSFPRRKEEKNLQVSCLSVHNPSLWTDLLIICKQVYPPSSWAPPPPSSKFMHSVEGGIPRAYRSAPGHVRHSFCLWINFRKSFSILLSLPLIGHRVARLRASRNGARVH